MKLQQLDTFSVSGALLAATLLTATGVAQKPVASAVRDAAVGRFVVDATGIRTGGEHYRVHFGERGVEFTPALGRQAPHTMPLRFEFDTVLRGGEVVFEATGATMPAQVGSRVDYDRGHGVTERYDVRGEGIKQSFVFQELAGSGDLVVRGRVVTDLEARPVAGVERVDFLQGAFGGVTIENVLGIDAMGQSATGSMNWDGQSLELVLPGSFVDHAHFPLILDPLVGSNRNQGSGNNDSEADGAFMESADVYLAAWERAFSNTDVEIRARVTDANNSNVTGWLAVTNGSNTLNLNPSVAAVQFRNRFVIAWQAGPGPLGPFDIMAATVDAAGVVGSSVRVTYDVTPTGPVSTPDSERLPVIAKKPTDSVTGTFIVFENAGVGIESRGISVNSTGGISAAAGSQVIASDANATRPRLSANNNSQAICWQSKNGSGFNTVKVSRVDLGGAINATISTISSSTGHRQSPDIDGDGTDFKLVFDSRFGDGGILHRDVTFSAGTTTLGSGSWVKIDAQQQFEPTIGLVGSKYLVMWTEEVGFLDFEVHGRGIENTTGLSFCGNEFVVGGNFDSETRPAIATQRSGSDLPTQNDEALLLWNSAEILTFTSRVRGQIYKSRVGATPVVLNPGCGNPLTLDENGPVALGSQNLKFRLTSTSSGLGLFLYGFGSTTPCPTGGTCVAINPVATAVVLITAPGIPYSVGFPLPCASSFVGLPLEVQGLLLGPSTGACTLFPDASLSERRQYALDF